MLNALPDELALLVLGSFIQWQNTGSGQRAPLLEPIGLRALASVCRTCKMLRDLAEPVLYHNYSKPAITNTQVTHLDVDNGDDHADPERAESVNHIQPNLSLRRLIRTLIERPDLAARVKCISLGQWETVDSLAFSGLKTHPRPAEEARRYYMTLSRLLLCSMSQPWATAWLYALSEGIEDAEIALLLALTPNVEQLELEIPVIAGLGSRLFLRKIVQMAICSRLHSCSSNDFHSFAHLKRLAVAGNRSQHDITSTTSKLLPELLELPGLECSQT